jgi:hypothetical protein
MTIIETLGYEMLVRTVDFGKEHINRFPESSLAREHFATAAAAVTQLSTHAVTKLSAAQEGKSPKAMAREALRDRKIKNHIDGQEKEIEQKWKGVICLL